LFISAPRVTHSCGPDSFSQFAKSAVTRACTRSSQSDRLPRDVCSGARVDLASLVHRQPPTPMHGRTSTQQVHSHLVSVSPDKQTKQHCHITSIACFFGLLALVKMFKIRSDLRTWFSWTRRKQTGILGLNDSREFQFPRITTHIAHAMAGDSAGYARRHSGEISSVTLEFADTVISSLQFCPGGSLIIFLRDARTGPKSRPYRGSIPVHVYSRF